VNTVQVYKIDMLSPTHSPIPFPLRKGKWSAEEEEYLSAMVRFFNAGLLNIPPGKSLRSYLSEKLNCDPMRITKKYSGSSAVGKQTFIPCEPTEENLLARTAGEHILLDLEQKFHFALREATTSDCDNLSGDDIAFSGGKETIHIKKKYRMQKSASDPSLNKLSERNDYMSNASSSRGFLSMSQHSGTSKLYTEEDAAAGHLLLAFMECARTKEDGSSSPYSSSLKRRVIDSETILRTNSLPASMEMLVVDDNENHRNEYFVENSDRERKEYIPIATSAFLQLDVTSPKYIKSETNGISPLVSHSFRGSPLVKAVKPVFTNSDHGSVV
jgi:hypothetical protein